MRGSKSWFLARNARGVFWGDVTRIRPKRQCGLGDSRESVISGRRECLALGALGAACVVGVVG